MATLKGGTQLWLAESVSPDDASAVGVVGVAPYVAFFIESSVAATFTVQAAAELPPRAGINLLDADAADGGLTWYDYSGAVDLAVEADTPIVFDVSPFAPSVVRLIRTDAGGASTITALVTYVGPN